MFEKILAATDGSEHGLRAAKVAVELGKISGGKVYAVYVADTQRTAHLPDDMLLFSIKELLLKEGKEAIKQVQELAEKNGVDFDGAVVEGNPSDETCFRLEPDRIAGVETVLIVDAVQAIAGVDIHKGGIGPEIYGHDR